MSRAWTIKDFAVESKREPPSVDELTTIGPHRLGVARFADFAGFADFIGFPGSVVA